MTTGARIVWGVGNLLPGICLALLGGMLLGFAAQAAGGYTLVLKDGRRIAVESYEEADGWLYYQRFDARIGIPRRRVETIISHASGEDTTPLEEKILGRVYALHQRRFTLSEFWRTDYRTAEIDPLLTPLEQAAYVRKLLQIKTQEIITHDDLRLAAEQRGDVVALAIEEDRLVAALTEWGRGRQALGLLIGPPDQPMAETAVASDPVSGVLPEDNTARGGKASSPPDVGAGQDDAAAFGGRDGAEKPYRRQEADRDEVPDVRPPGLQKLHRRQETLRLQLKKYYRAPAESGGYLDRQAAARELRIVGLQIRFFDRLPPDATDPALPAGAGP
jgi:hypothetical protein